MFLSAALGLLAIGNVALADDPSLPSPVAEALTAVVDDGHRDNWRFRMSISTSDAQLVGYFDGSMAEGEQWALETPMEDELDETLRAIWEDVIDPSEDSDEGSGLFFSSSDFAYAPGSIALLDASGGISHFAFSPVIEAEGLDLSEHLTGVLSVSDDPARVHRVRVYAEESFKPNFAVRINAFELIQDYTQIDGLPAPVMTRSVQRFEASAAFQTIEQAVEISFRDIEYLAE